MKQSLRSALRYHGLQIVVATVALAPLAWRIAQPVAIAGVHIQGVWSL